MPAGEYDIFAEQGTSFTLGITYKDANNTVIDLDGYTGSMQVRRSVSDNQALLFLTGNTYSASVTGGGITQEFTTGGLTGVQGTGGIQLNTSATGGTGTDGGIYVSIDAVTMANLPTGKHRYDIELQSGTTVDRLLKGVFEVDGEVTK
tara:strand:- start:132 stop:575 length:444 start_codon:yes stop_codon:yes gene_type:complete